MSEKGTRTLERSSPARGDEAEGTERGSGGLTAAAKRRATRVFSPRAFLVAAALSAAGLFVGGMIPLLPGFVTGPLGVLAGGFVAGLVTGGRRYLETGAAGAAVVGAAFALDFLMWTLVGVGVPIVALGVALGFAAGVVGYYLGRDLKRGLTADLGDL